MLYRPETWYYTYKQKYGLDDGTFRPELPSPDCFMTRRHFMSEELEKTGTEVSTESELIRELLKAQKKQLRTDRIRTIIVMLFLAGVIAIGIFIFKEYKTIEATIETIQTSVASIDTNEINKAVIELTGAANSLQQVDTDQLNNSVGALEGAANNLAAMDIEELNKTVTALEGAAKNLSEMDIDQLNDLVESLNKVAQSLEKAADNIKNLFSFGRD